jgi:glutamate N-acetyltransferase/amino-acid N-acetyltransferase
VHVARNHWLAAGKTARYWLINTGNANAGTGEPGMAAALGTCNKVAALGGVSGEQVMPFSTGVIGELLPEACINVALPAAFEALTQDGWERAANAILTTDTRAKVASRSLLIDGKTVTLTGMSKGAGMIRPDMATMLAFFATDAVVEEALLASLFKSAVAASFNRITVDGDTSTNDAAVIAATGASGAVVSAQDSDTLHAFSEALTLLAIELAQAIVRDGEGATKFVEVRVEGGATTAECDAVAYTIAHSPLVKTALFASDPNWGRLLAAIGRAELSNLAVEGVGVYINDVLIAENGARAASYTEEQGVAAMAAADLEIRVTLGRGEAISTVWTTDFSYDYVKINAEYRT